MSSESRLDAHVRIQEKALDIVANNNRSTIDLTPLIKQLAFHSEVLQRLLAELEKRDIKIDLRDIFDKFKE